MSATCESNSWPSTTCLQDPWNGDIADLKGFRILNSKTQSPDYSAANSASLDKLMTNSYRLHGHEKNKFSQNSKAQENLNCEIQNECDKTKLCSSVFKKSLYDKDSKSALEIFLQIQHSPWRKQKWMKTSTTNDDVHQKNTLPNQEYRQYYQQNVTNNEGEAEDFWKDKNRRNNEPTGDSCDSPKFLHAQCHFQSQNSRTNPMATSHQHIHSFIPQPPPLYATSQPKLNCPIDIPPPPPEDCCIVQNPLETKDVEGNNILANVHQTHNSNHPSNSVLPSHCTLARNHSDPQASPLSHRLRIQKGILNNAEENASRSPMIMSVPFMSGSNAGTARDQLNCKNVLILSCANKKGHPQPPNEFPMPFCEQANKLYRGNDDLLVSAPIDLCGISRPRTMFGRGQGLVKRFGVRKHRNIGRKMEPTPASRICYECRRKGHEASECEARLRDRSTLPNKAKGRIPKAPGE